MRMSERSYAIGIDVGVTNIKSVCVEPSGAILCRKSIETRAEAPNWPDRVRRLVEQFEGEYGRTGAIGVAAPGIAAPDGTCISWMQGRLDAVQGLNWTTFLSRPQPVPVLNDAQAALLGEVWLGAARRASNALLLTLGTGVGGALMVDGRLLKGHLGRAGHLGHISLNPDGALDIANTPGSLEEAIGNCTIRKRSNGRFGSTHELIAACEANDREAIEIWNRSIRALAAGIASLINVADPEVVILGGGIARAGNALLAPLQRELDRFEWRPHGKQVRLVMAELGEYAGAIGAAKNALAFTPSPL
jgi:glucokinase